MGSRIANIILHPKAVATIPPKEGPTAGAIAVIKVATPIINPRFSSGTCSKTILNINGSAIPVPTPCIILPDNSTGKEGAMSASNVPEKNRVIAVQNSFFVS